MSEAAQTSRRLYQTGQSAFERGDYREAVQSLEKAAALSARGSALGGEIQTWLVTAYEAAGQRAEALTLCRQLVRHPSSEVRKQNKRLLYILEAPILQRRPEWLNEIPDLKSLTEAEPQDRLGTASSKSSQRRPQTFNQPQEPLEVNRRENTGFLWIALAVALGSLIWFGWFA